jgi:hypothetical protein
MKSNYLSYNASYFIVTKKVLRMAENALRIAYLNNHNYGFLIIYGYDIFKNIDTNSYSIPQSEKSVT